MSTETLTNARKMRDQLNGLYGYLRELLRSELTYLLTYLLYFSLYGQNAQVLCAAA